MAEPGKKKNGTTSVDSQGTPSSSQPPGQGGSTPQGKGRELRAVVATSTKQGVEPNVLRRPPKLLACYRIGGILFAFDRSFVRDNSATVRSLNMIKKGLETYPDGKLAIFGHADYVDTAAYNKKLSERRAESVYALLTLKEDIWKRLYSEEKWGEDRSIASVIKDDPTSIRAYMEKLLKKAGLKQVPNNNLCPIWPKSSRNYPYMGCSEFNPHRVFNSKQIQAHQKDHRLRDKENAPNRRVVIFLFDKKNIPLFPCMHSSESSVEEAVKNCDIPKNWKQNREYKRHVTLTFACKFYDSQVSRDCREELTVPKLMSYPSAVILFKGYEIGLRRDRYCVLSIRDEKGRTGEIQYTGLLFGFKRWENDYYFSIHKTDLQKRVELADKFGKRADDLRNLLKTVTDNHVREELEHEIYIAEILTLEHEDIAEHRMLGQSVGEYLRRIAGSILLDMWVVEKLSRKHSITSTAEADQPPDEPIPFTPIDWNKAVIIERRGGQGFERPLLDYRAEELAEWVAQQPYPKGYPRENWEYWATEQGKAEVKATLLGRSITESTPNGSGTIKRSTTGMSVVGFGENKDELDGSAKNDLLNWVKTCIKDPELSYPPERFGYTRVIFDSKGNITKKEFKSYREVWEGRRKLFNKLRWRVYVFPAPSMKEWESGNADELTKKRADYIGSLLRNDSILKDIVVSGWGGAIDSPWAPPSVDYEQVWKLAEIAAGS